jgi:hypothetical protein
MDGGRGVVLWCWGQFEVTIVVEVNTETILWVSSDGTHVVEIAEH